MGTQESEELFHFARRGKTKEVRELLDRATSEVWQGSAYEATNANAAADGTSEGRSSAESCCSPNSGSAGIRSETRWDDLLGYKDYQGTTSLMIASMGGHADIVEMLLRHGIAAINAGNENGYSALTMAVLRGHVATAAVLLAHGANVDALDAEGASCLIHAAYAGHVPTVELLLASGADACIVDPDLGGIGVRGTALEIAQARGHRKVVAVLRDHARDQVHGEEQDDDRHSGLPHHTTRSPGAESRVVSKL